MSSSVFASHQIIPSQINYKWSAKVSSAHGSSLEWCSSCFALDSVWIPPSLQGEDWIECVEGSWAGYRNQLYSEADCPASAQRAQVITDYSWEKLNTGTWRDVDKEWRRVYSFGCLFKVLSLCHGNPSQYDIQEAIKTCDMGLLMGAGIMDNILQRLVGVLRNKMKTKSPNRAQRSEEPCSKVKSTAWRICDSLCTDISWFLKCAFPAVKLIKIVILEIFRCYYSIYKYFEVALIFIFSFKFSFKF